MFQHKLASNDKEILEISMFNIENPPTDLQEDPLIVLKSINQSVKRNQKKADRIRGKNGSKRHLR